jgi:hypothetical protein
MSSRKSFLLRISPALYREMEGWAQQELRSVNAQIEYVLAQAVARRGRRVPPELPADEPKEPQEGDLP